jgi:hypothetical protein
VSSAEYVERVGEWAVALGIGSATGWPAAACADDNGEGVAVRREWASHGRLEDVWESCGLLMSSRVPPVQIPGSDDSCTILRLLTGGARRLCGCLGGESVIDPRN